MGVASTIHVVGSMISLMVGAALLAPFLIVIGLWRLWRQVHLRVAYGGDEAARRKDLWQDA